MPACHLRGSIHHRWVIAALSWPYTNHTARPRSNVMMAQHYQQHSYLEMTMQCCSWPSGTNDLTTTMYITMYWERTAILTMAQHHGQHLQITYVLCRAVQHLQPYRKVPPCLGRHSAVTVLTALYSAVQKSNTALKNCSIFFGPSISH